MLTYRNWAMSPRSIYTDEAALEFCTEELNAALTYWSNCAGGEIPYKKSLSPREMKHFLGQVSIFEKKPQGLYLIRLMGTRLTSVIGEMQGRDIPDALPAETACRWTQALDAVISSRHPRRIVSHLAVGRLEYLEAEILLAPLLGENGLLNMVLGVAAFTVGIHSANQRAEADPHWGT